MKTHKYVIDEQTGGLPLGAHRGTSQRQEGDFIIAEGCDCDEYTPQDVYFEPLVVEFQERFKNPIVRAIARAIGIKTLEIPPSK